MTNKNPVPERPNAAFRQDLEVFAWKKRCLDAEKRNKNLIALLENVRDSPTFKEMSNAVIVSHVLWNRVRDTIQGNETS